MDRLSLLPESLISVILALIPLRDAVRTSALGSGWRHSWRFRPDMEINQTHFPSPAACLRFAADWILHYPPATKIHSFSLTFPSPDRQHTVALYTLIRFAIDHQTTILQLDFTPAAGENYDDEPFEMPNFVQQYDGLDTLHLSSCRFRASNFTFSRLKTASFHRVVFSNSMVMRLFLICRLLENLSLIECSEASIFTLVLPRLTTLVIENCPDLTLIALFTENLRRFKFVGSMVEFGSVTLRSLEEVDIDLNPATHYIDEEPGESIYDLLIKFSRARVLSVCSYTTQVISTALDPFMLPRTIAARSLTIRTGFDADELCGIGCLLNSCPSLETLRFVLTLRKYIEYDRHIIPYEVDPGAFWGGEFRAPTSILNNLQEIEMDGFVVTGPEFRFLRFVVQNGGVLRKIRLKLERDEEEHREQLSRELPVIIGIWGYRSPYPMDILIE